MNLLFIVLIAIEVFLVFVTMRALWDDSVPCLRNPDIRYVRWSA